MSDAGQQSPLVTMIIEGGDAGALHGLGVQELSAFLHLEAAHQEAIKKILAGAGRSPIPINDVVELRLTTLVENCARAELRERIRPIPHRTRGPCSTETRRSELAAMLASASRKSKALLEYSFAEDFDVGTITAMEGASEEVLQRFASGIEAITRKGQTIRVDGHAHRVGHDRAESLREAAGSLRAPTIEKWCYVVGKVSRVEVKAGANIILLRRESDDPIALPLPAGDLAPYKNAQPNSLLERATAKLIRVRCRALVRSTNGRVSTVLETSEDVGIVPGPAIGPRVCELEELWRDWDPEDGPRPRKEDLRWIEEFSWRAVEHGLSCPHLYFRDGGCVSAEWIGGPAARFPSMDVVRSKTGIRFLSSWWESTEGGRSRKCLRSDLPVSAAHAQVLEQVDAATQLASRSFGDRP